MAVDTYSFTDVHVVFGFKGFRAYTLGGEGIGEVSIEFEAANTIHDRAADGKIMASKIKADNGSVHITMQQTSHLHKYLKAAFNFMNAAPTALWAAGSIYVTNLHGLDIALANGVSFEKRAGQPYQAQGQMVTWNFLAASILYQ